MRQETFTLNQKELQRVSVIGACIKGDMACARAAELLCLSVRHIKRLKKRLREDGEAALAHANRGRPSHRRMSCSQTGMPQLTGFKWWRYAGGGNRRNEYGEARTDLWDETASRG
jgi:hypothetical protein